jgi:glycosyltransferase involved in cell wall biosynthesis
MLEATPHLKRLEPDWQQAIARQVAAAARPFAQPRLIDAAVLSIVVALWFTPTWLLVISFPLLATWWWRRRRVLGAAAGTPLDKPIYALVGLGVVALLPSLDLEASLPRLLGLWLGAAVYLAVFDLLTSEKRMWLVGSGLATAGILLAMIGLVGTDWPSAGAPSLERVYSHLPRLITFLPRSDSGGLNPDKLAAALAMLLPLPAAVMVFTPGRLLRLGWGIGTVVLGSMLILTQSGTGLLAAGGALLALGVARSRWFLLAIPFLAVPVLALARLVGPWTFAGDLLAGSNGSLEDRLALWRLALSLIAAHPLLGIGIGTFSEVVGSIAPASLLSNGRLDVPHAHNLYLQFALDLGLPGLVAFIAMLAGAAHLTWRAVRRGPTARARGLVAGLACGLLAYLIYGFTDAIGPGEKPGLFLWLLLACIAAGARLAQREPASQGPGAWADEWHGSPPPIGSVIYLSSFEWSYHTARPQQLARTLGERVPVLYVETTGLRGLRSGDLLRMLRRIRRGLAGRHRVLPGVWVFSPIVLPFPGSRLIRALNRLLLRDAIRGQARDLGLSNPLLLISVPTAAGVDLVGHLDEVASMYDCMDDLTVIPMVDASIGATEAQLAQRADVMVAASEQLRLLKAHIRDDVVVVGQGVDAAHFSRPAPCPPELACLPRPLLLCVAGIDERIDFALLDEVARMRPEWSIALVGPELYLRAGEAIDQPNVHLLGPRAYADLPGYLQAADVCLIPYRDTPWARACNPVKTLEYLAAGRPVVSTDLPAMRPHEPLVRVAQGAPEFVAAVQDALAADSPSLATARGAVASGASWHMRAETLYRLGARAAKRRRRGRR